MLRSIFIGLVAGQRSMTPLAALAYAVRRENTRTEHNPEGALMRRPLIGAGGVAMAVAEMAGDKMESAPDRTVFLGLLARAITGGFSGAAVARPKDRTAGALLGAGAAIGSSYYGLAARKWAMQRWGQTTTGLIEDALVFSAAMMIANARDIE